MKLIREITEGLYGDTIIFHDFFNYDADDKNNGKYYFKDTYKKKGMLWIAEFWNTAPYSTCIDCGQIDPPFGHHCSKSKFTPSGLYAKLTSHNYRSKSLYDNRKFAYTITTDIQKDLLWFLREEGIL